VRLLRLDFAKSPIFSLGLRSDGRTPLAESRGFGFASASFRTHRLPACCVRHFVVGFAKVTIFSLGLRSFVRLAVGAQDLQ